MAKYIFSITNTDTADNINKRWHLGHFLVGRNWFYTGVLDYPLVLRETDSDHQYIIRDCFLIKLFVQQPCYYKTLWIRPLKISKTKTKLPELLL